MRIIHIMGMDSTKYGGAESFIFKLAEECKTRNIDMHIVYNSQPQSDSFINDIKSVNAKIHILKDDKCNIYKFYKLIKELRPDIIHIHFSDYVMQIVHIILAYIFCAKIYRSVECCVYHNKTLVETKRQLHILLRIMQLDGLIYNFYTKILFVSKFMMSQYECIFGHKDNYQSIYLGIKPPKSYSVEQKAKIREGLGVAESDMVITTVLFASVIKGPDIFIRSLQHIQHSNTRFVIIGLDDNLAYTKQLKELATSLGVFDRIIWTGIINNVSDIFAISDIYVQPSRTEALSLAACEVLSYRVPCVAANVGGLPEVASFLFKREDSEDLAAKINHIIENPQLMQHYQDEAYLRYVSNFDIENGVKLYADAYVLQQNKTKQ